MEQEKDTGQPFQVTVKREYRTEHSDVGYINYVRFALAGTDVVMDVGVIDPDRIHSLTLDPSLPREVAACILRRYGMSVNTFAMLKRHVEEIWQKIDISKAVDRDLPRG